jgi:signal transduction histidine kinase
VARTAVRHADADMNTVNSVSFRPQEQIITVVAHELRFPLTPIRNAAALLRQVPADTATVRRAAEIIERQATRLDRLITDLVDVSRMQYGVLEVRSQRTKLSDLLNLALESAGRIATERGHALTVSASPEPIYLDVDLPRLARALHHLIANACHYSDAPAYIHVRAQREGLAAVISVSDTGVGIADAERESIFGLFVRLDHSRKSETGLGLGLYFARQLVEAHGGTIDVESRRGKGSDFTVRLPCEPITASEVGPEDAEPAGDLSPA